MSVIKNSEGELYLEVHHVIPLSKNGYDKTTNAVALCPNCQKKSHDYYGEISRIVKTIRFIREKRL